jgi:hypothetical protein
LADDGPARRAHLPARVAALEGLIRRAKAIDGLWVASGEEIARWVASLDLPGVVHEPPQV